MLKGATSQWVKDYPPFIINHIPTFKWYFYSKSGTREFKYLITEI